MKLTDRDIGIMQAIADFRFATAKQVALMANLNLQTARIRLGLLWQNRFLDRLDLPVFVGEGSPPAVYVISSLGRKVLAEHLGIDTALIPRVDAKRNYFFLLHHTLRRNDFRAALTSACRSTPNLKLLFWKQDKEIGDSMHVPLKREQEKVRVPLVPDGFFGIQTPNGSAYAFVEIDRGTVGLKKFLLKQRGYFHWWLEKKNIEKYGEKNFRVLTVTTNSRRMHNLIRATLRVKDSQQGSGLFWFTTFDQVDLDHPESILSPIWVRAKAQNGQLWSLT